MWDLIVSVPDHCLSFYLAFSHSKNKCFIVSGYSLHREDILLSIMLIVCKNDLVS